MLSKREILVGGGQLTGLALLGGCGLLGETHHFRYRLKIIARQGTEVFEGSSVVQASWHDQTGSAAAAGSGQGFGLGWKGEAPVLDLGALGSVFALLIKTSPPPSPGHAWPFDENYPSRMIMGVLGPLCTEEFNADKQDEEYTTRLLRRIKAIRHEVTIPADWLPTLVRFTDLNDPSSVALVDPYELESTFARGVIFVGGTVQLIHSTLTRGVVTKHLPWLKGRKDWLTLDGQISRSTQRPYLANKITTECFGRGW